MILSELIKAFEAKHVLESMKRGAKEQFFPAKQLALMLSETCSDIQKSFGIIEVTEDVSITSGTDKYNLNQSVMTIKNVVLGESLTEKSTEWFQKQLDASGTPQYYTILFESAIPIIWLYPNPSTDDTLTISYKSNFNFYSPSGSSPQDFGAFDGSDFSGNTVFPSIYDKLIILGMMKQIFPDMEAQYMQESMLLRAKQFNGEAIKYNMDGVI